MRSLRALSFPNTKTHQGAIAQQVSNTIVYWVSSNYQVSTHSGIWSYELKSKSYTLSTHPTATGYEKLRKGRQHTHNIIQPRNDVVKSCSFFLLLRLLELCSSIAGENNVTLKIEFVKCDRRNYCSVSKNAPKKCVYTKRVRIKWKYMGFLCLQWGW